MITGARLFAPEGFRSLVKGHCYHFLSSDAVNNRVRLVEFTDQGKEVRTLLFTLTRFEFEEALESGTLLASGDTDKFPPWLDPIKGIKISERERQRVSAKESYDQKVNRRFMAISGLMVRLHEVLSSDDPDAVINAHAKSQSPKQNAGRLRLWFYTYITFGQNKWALMPALHRIGKWDREGPDKVRRLGRPSPNGKDWGYRGDTPMKVRIRAAYLKFRSVHKTFNDLYRKILTEEFGCVSVERDGKTEFINRKGYPFPTFDQVRYCIEQSFSQKDRSVGALGNQKTRNKSGSTGSFSERLTNLYQQVEFDGYYIVEQLSGVTEGNPVGGFCVVRAVCGLSGMIIGIGFAEAKESREAYRMCLFSMATDKVWFCGLFGVSIKPEWWPCEGLSGGLVFDRGPAANLDTEPEINWLGVLENTPVYSGQSKATVESSHPRAKTNLDQPTYVHSTLNFVQMARREIEQVLKDNRSSDASGRMETEMYLCGIKPTPLGIWDYWDSRFRNSAIGMQQEVAVRSFLAVHSAIIRQDAVYFYGRKYRSDDLVSTGIFDRVARGSVVEVEAYALTMCVRHIWIDVGGELFQLDFVTTQRAVDGDRDISLRDLQALDALRRKSQTALRNEIPAIHQFHEDRFKEETGEDWNGGVRRFGRPPKTASAQRDVDDYDRFRGKAK